MAEIRVGEAREVRLAEGEEGTVTLEKGSAWT